MTDAPHQQTDRPSLESLQEQLTQMQGQLAELQARDRRQTRLELEQRQLALQPVAPTVAQMQAGQTPPSLCGSCERSRLTAYWRSGSRAVTRYTGTKPITEQIPLIETVTETLCLALHGRAIEWPVLHCTQYRPLMTE